MSARHCRGIPKASGPALSMMLLMVSITPAIGATTDAGGVGTRSVFAPESTVTTEASHLVPHAPIHILGDSDLTSANGVVGGTGAPTDPFVISGWEIAAGVGEVALSIESTTASVSVRDCSLDSSGPEPALLLGAVERVEVTRTSLRTEGTLVARVNASDSVALRDLRLSAAKPGWELLIQDSQRVSVESADIRSGSVRVDRSTSVLIARNAFTGSGALGAVLGEGRATLEMNRIDSRSRGVMLTGGSHRVENNWVVGSQSGLVAQGGGGHLLVNNTINISSGPAVSLGAGTGGNTVAGNNLLAASTPVAVDDSVSSGWSSGAMGNYWSGWTSPDSDGDGIVDIPFAVPGSSNSVDPLPSVKPLARWDPAPPSRPKIDGLAEGEEAGNLTVTIRWQPTESELPLASYTLLRGRVPGALSLLATLDPWATAEYVDRGVKPGGVYFYALRARNAAGSSEGSDISEIKLRDPGLPDLWLSPLDFTVTPFQAQEGDTVRVEGLVRNRGNWSANSARVRFFEGNPSASGLRLELKNISVLAGAATPVVAQWTLGRAPYLTVEVDAVIPPDILPGEQLLVLKLERPAQTMPWLPALLIACVPLTLLIVLVGILHLGKRRFRHLPSVVRRPKARR